MRPASIVLFERIYWFAIVVGIISAIWSYMNLSVMVPNMPPQIAGIMPAIMLAGLAIGLLINILLWYFIARQGAEIAKWIFVVLFALGVVGLVRSFMAPQVELSLIMRLTAIAKIVLQAVCVWLLFRPDSNAWFRRTA